MNIKVSPVFERQFKNLKIEIARKYHWVDRKLWVNVGSYFIDVFIPLYQGGLYFSFRTIYGE